MQTIRDVVGFATGGRRGDRRPDRPLEPPVEARPAAVALLVAVVPFAFGVVRAIGVLWESIDDSWVDLVFAILIAIPASLLALAGLVIGVPWALGVGVALLRRQARGPAHARACGVTGLVAAALLFLVGLPVEAAALALPAAVATYLTRLR